MTQPAHYDPTDPRALQIARHFVVSWGNLSDTDQTLILNSAASFILAAESAGILPPRFPAANVPGSTAEQLPDHRHPTPDGTYLSTGCLHGDLLLPDGRTGHGYCADMTGANGTKRPGECKFCRTKCSCPCHDKETPDGR